MNNTISLQLNFDPLTISNAFSHLLNMHINDFSRLMLNNAYSLFLTDKHRCTKNLNGNSEILLQRNFHAIFLFKTIRTQDMQLSIILQLVICLITTIYFIKGTLSFAITIVCFMSAYINVHTESNCNFKVTVHL